ncbi:MAG: DNA cytosine methyltransferase [Pseudomonadota bacterium]
MKKRRAGSFYEFFCGGGMAHAGLNADWSCLFANDFDHKKSATYKRNWGDSVIKTADVKAIKTSDLPEGGDLVWASFPCQDLSLAGGGAGLKGERSGTFWPFWDLMKSLISEQRAPKMIVLENVCGTLNSHGGKDFKAICESFSKSGYRYGAVVIDAALFVPQSRPRLFVIAVRENCVIPEFLSQSIPSDIWHTATLRNAQAMLPKKYADDWIWWHLPKPSRRRENFVDLIEEEPDSVVWHSKAETKKLLSMMSELNSAKVKAAMQSGKKMVGAIYKRTRIDESGYKVQRAEVRFDDVAGCLRTPAGGSSRQLIIVVEKNKVRSRLISSRETARLMGLKDSYILPKKYNEAYHLTGDGVVVPVVKFLSDHLLKTIYTNNVDLARGVA